MIIEKYGLNEKKVLQNLVLITNFLLKNHLHIANWPSGRSHRPYLKIVVLTSPAQKSKFYKITKNSESSYHLALILLLNPENITTFEKKLQEQWTVLSTWCKTIVSAEIDSQQPGAANTASNPKLTARVNWWKPIGQPQTLKPYAKVSTHFHGWLPESWIAT